MGKSAEPSPNRVRALVSGVVGLAVGLALAEAAFHVRDHGAFPHLNAYVADAALGVRLRPLATERISFQKNPVSDVRINEGGYRGAAWGAPSPDEILVVGDSQVFGLGVEENETFSAALAKTTGRPVRNAGVPTYGPGEYLAVIKETLRDRTPRTVVFAINMVNDLFEVSRPNVERHVVWDGWAVRKETAPGTITSFPGRELLFRESHAVYALRSWLYARGGAEIDDRGFASEGTWHDVVGKGQKETEEKTAAEQALTKKVEERDRAIDTADERAKQAQKRIEDLAWKTFPDLDERDGASAYKAAHGSPADIVVSRTITSEAARKPSQTVKSLLRGAEIRRQIEREIKRRAAEEGGEAGKKILAAFDERKKAEQTLGDLKKMAPPVDPPRAFSPLAPVIAEAKKLCDQHGAMLVVLVLPIDVQVSDSEWAKYGEERVDMAPARILVDDILDAAKLSGAVPVDATPALVAAEPGAFLFADIHLTPKGHAAVAGALAKALAGAR